MNYTENISVEVEFLGKGRYNTYISTECSSGANYPNITAKDIGSFVTDLVDTLEEEHSGESYVHFNYELIRSDGYTINRTLYDSKSDARQAMIAEYNKLNHNDENDEWDNLSYLHDDDALLYDHGDDVYVWKIFRCEE